MSLDINTERGQATLADEMRLAYLFETHAHQRYIHTPKNLACCVDALIVDDETHPGMPVITAVAESKCRYDLTLAKLLKEFRGEWLVTFAKLTIAQHLADSIAVPLYGFLYLVDENVLLTKCLYLPTRGWITKFRVEQTETKATCNGGAAIRANAYIDMRDATVIRQAVLETPGTRASQRPQGDQ